MLYASHTSPFSLLEYGYKIREEYLWIRERGNKQTESGTLSHCCMSTGLSNFSRLLSFNYIMQPGSILSPVCSFPSHTLPLVAQHTSVFWMGQERSGSLWQCPVRLGIPDSFSQALLFPHGRNHGLRRSLLALSRATLEEE